MGAGGHAKVVIATARAAGFAVRGVVDDDVTRHGAALLGVPITGPARDVLRDPDAHAVLAIGDNRTRHRLAGDARCRFATVVHPGAILDPSVRLGPGTVVFAGAVIQPDTTIGAHVIVNTGASIDHDGRLDDFVHIAPGVRLAGNVSLDTGAFLGIASAAIPGVRIGAWTTVGAGAAVIKDLPAGVIAAGVPARVLRSAR
ncbi:MAG TPA: acetyltransferase [Kofleriaceae bacterium]|nr:acetyltransferase [Kofleriaceae bacterium]